MPLFLAFLLVPIIEIGLFIQVGSVIGLWPTLGIVILTAILGTWLVKTQGRLALGQLRGSFEQLSDPTEPLAHGAMILLAGALLLTPGFFTDAMGFVLLVPGFRSRAFAYLRSKVTVASFQMGTGPANRPTHTGPQPGNGVIDGEFEDVTPRPRHKGPSGWVEDQK
ncbi:FxsA family protein [Tritonibacter horizontis]|uniref:Phage T7 F exclusion suppressor FxsA n=1 Tax=Tritonibacter horizontis TaxID=1768241 RepID=A0A132C2J0_9RHOB|nr:FxsA family protein [Tritonibacter horizontis]KUP94809.1 phage T7 F exclusion suppressor FxsA [Tritonibacter horizontis]